MLSAGGNLGAATNCPALLLGLRWVGCCFWGRGGTAKDANLLGAFHPCPGTASSCGAQGRVGARARMPQDLRGRQLRWLWPHPQCLRLWGCDRPCVGLGAFCRIAEMLTLLLAAFILCLAEAVLPSQGGDTSLCSRAAGEWGGDGAGMGGAGGGSGAGAAVGAHLPDPPLQAPSTSRAACIT